MDRIWFKAKKYGWGWYPATWEGWLIILTYAVIFTALLKSMNSTNMFFISILQIIGLTTILFIICILTGEKPKWRWGEKK